jgi:hypothetical protein
LISVVPGIVFGQIIHNVIWFTPTHVDQINGIDIGLYTKNLNGSGLEAGPLMVNGISVEGNPIALAMFLITINKGFVGDDPDNVRAYIEKPFDSAPVYINGLNASFCTLNNMQLRGLNLSCSTTVVDEVHGVSLSPVSNFSYIMNGFTLAVYNRATLAHGLQIGLYNKSTDMRGVQIGLWNVNGRRSLPFINWQFKRKKN